MIFIPGNVPSSKNGRVWTGKYFVVSKATQKYYRESNSYWQDHKDEFLSLIEFMEFPYRIKFKFIRATLRAFDYINPLQTVQDLMVRHGWLIDDNADYLLPKLMPYELGEVPGVWISV